MATGPGAWHSAGVIGEVRRFCGRTQLRVWFRFPSRFATEQCVEYSAPIRKGVPTAPRQTNGSVAQTPQSRVGRFNQKPIAHTAPAGLCFIHYGASDLNFSIKSS